MKTVIIFGIVILTFGLWVGESAGELKYGELRLGAHGSYINPKDSDFEHVFGYGAIAKYKFTDTLGIEMGVDYFRWSLDEGDIEMPYSSAP